MIRHLRHGEIDKAWWDRCLEDCTNRLWYARSHVLDAASPGWEALVDEPGGAIMPLTKAHKWGFHYLRQPFAIQQLGVFSPAPAPARCHEFLGAVPLRFKLWDIRLNGVDCLSAPSHVQVRQAMDRVIDLGDGLDAVRARYVDSHRRGIRKWASAGDPEPMEADAFIDFVLRSPQVHDWQLTSWQREGFDRLVHVAMERGEGRAMGIRFNGAWVAAGLFVSAWDRVIFLKGLANETGRGVFAMHRLIDAMIADAASGHALFDLAGGEHAGLERFYAGFGARPDLYLHARVNRLPQPLRWYKQWNDGA